MTINDRDVHVCMTHAATASYCFFSSVLLLLQSVTVDCCSTEQLLSELVYCNVLRIQIVTIQWLLQTARKSTRIPSSKFSTNIKWHLW